MCSILTSPLFAQSASHMSRLLSVLYNLLLDEKEELTAVSQIVTKEAVRRDLCAGFFEQRAQNVVKNTVLFLSGPASVQASRETQINVSSEMCGPSSQQLRSA